MRKLCTFPTQTINASVSFCSHKAQENSSGLLCLKAFLFRSDKDVHSTETNFINHKQEV